MKAWSRPFFKILFFTALATGTLGSFAGQTTLSASEQKAYQEAYQDVPPVKVSLIHEDASVKPGRPFWVAVLIDIPKGLHAYWKNPGEAGMPLSFEWQLPEGWQAGPIHWPVPEKFQTDAVIGYGYEEKAYFLAEITPVNVVQDVEKEIGVTVSWLVCSEENCLPGQSEVLKKVIVSEQTPDLYDEYTPFFTEAKKNLPHKTNAVSIEKKDKTVLLHLNEENVSALANKKAYFFPESGIHKEESLATEYDPVKGEIVVVLPENQEKFEKIEGILAFAGSSDQDRIGYEISIPMQTNSFKETAPPLTSGIQSSTNQFEGGFGLALLFAFLGGILLNLMPCVLPVLSFKVMGFMKMAGESRSLTIKHGLVFSIGVLLSFWALAGAMLILQAYGSAVGWGFQLQNPLFVAGLAILLFVFSLSLFGVFELGTSVASMAGQKQVSAGNSSSAFVSSFFSGVLATAIATPCTGPFLGTAVGFAFTLAAPLAMLIFTSLGLGMAFPYLILSIFPALLRFLPKPGTWMVIFKELMGFLLLATVLWLVWVFGAQTSLMAVALLLASFLSFSIGCWVYGKWTTPMTKKLSRNIAYLFTCIFFAFGLYMTYTSTTDKYTQNTSSLFVNSQSDWIPFSEEKLLELRKEGKPVFIDFTAEWCLSCKANHLVLSSSSVAEKFQKAGVVKMVADWTKRDPKVTEALRKFGRNSIPLYVLYSGNPNEEPQILPQILTPDIVMQSIDQVSHPIALADNE